MKQINLPIAAKDSQEINLSNRHVGTTDFFRPFLNYCLETHSKDKVKASFKQVVQGYPLAGSVLGQFTHSMHAFWNPFRTVMTDWNNFITGLDCRFFDVDKTDLYGSNVNRLLVGKRKDVPLLSRNDIFYMFFPDKIGFEPSNYESLQGNTSPYLGVPVRHSSTSANGITAYVGDLISHNVLDNNPFIAAYAVTAASIYTFQNWSAPDSLDYTKAKFQPGSKFDVVGNIYVPDTANTYYIGIIFTPYGRLMWQMLRSLGYKFVFGGYFRESDELSHIDLDANSYTLIADYQREENTKNLEVFSALPLLSLYKVFIDWFIPSKFKNNYDVMLQTMSMLQYPFREMHETESFYLTKPYPLMSEVLLYTSYQNDYFTNAFLYPNGTNSGESEGIEIQDFTLGGVGTTSYGSKATQSESEYGVFNTPYLTSQGANSPSQNVAPKNISVYALRALRALNNYVRRNQLVGYRAIDRFLARFGVKLDYVQTNRSVLLASSSKDMFPQVIQANADTHIDSAPTPESQQALLGGLASNIYFGNELKCDADFEEKGLFIVISSIYPKVGYVQGIDRSILHKELTDFYIPEFDSLGVQPILFDELYADRHVGVNRSGSIFGYAPRYAEYKTKQDDLSGDFVLPSKNAFLQSLHTFRIFTPENVPASINNEFLIGDGAEYDRIFAMDTDDYDHLQTVSYNDVVTYRAMDSMSHQSDVTDGSGQYMQTQIGGNHVIR